MQVSQMQADRTNNCPLRDAFKGNANATLPIKTEPGTTRNKSGRGAVKFYNSG